jgi:hypothetical protein
LNTRKGKWVSNTGDPESISPMDYPKLRNATRSPGNSAVTVVARDTPPSETTATPACDARAVQVRDRGGRRRGLAPMDSSLLASFSSSSVPPKPKPLASTPPAAVASPSPAMRPSCHRHLTLPGYAPVLPSIPIHARHCAAGPQPCPGGSGPGRRGGEEVASGADRGVFPGSDGAAGARGVWGASEGAQFLGHDLNKSQNVSFIWIIGWRLFLTFYIYSLF